MTDQEVLVLLRKIDNGYKPTESEKKSLSNIEKITWKNIENIPESIDILDGLTELDVSGELSDNSRLIAIPKSIGNLSNLQRLFLSNTKLSALPESIGNLMSLQSLYLNSTHLSALPESIGNLMSLQSLYLNSTHLSALPESIGNLTSLQSLDLSSTHLSELPESVGNLTSLRSFDLCNTQLSELPKSIWNLTSLRSLDLSNTQLTELPEGIGYLTNLQCIDLSNTKINRLPESIWHLLGLRILNLSHTSMTMLPESIWNLTSLQRLDLNSTQISMLPESIGHLLKLRSLNLSNTRMRTLPESIGNLSRLESFGLSSTQIEYLPESIGNLSNLESFDLSSTQIEYLPECIGNLICLKNLDLSYTQLNNLPESFWGLINLQNLNLEYSQIKGLHRSIGQLTNLQYLNLSSTQILYLPGSIGNLLNLKILNLTNTSINYLPLNIGKLTCLQYLDLSSTRIKQLPESIGHLSSLESINLSSTQIEYLPRSLGNLMNLKSLDLSLTWINQLPDSIGNLNNLHLLDLSCTRIRDIGIITCLASLRKLRLYETMVDDISCLYNLEKLDILDIALSKVTDISVLGKLTMLRRLDISGTNVKDISSLKELFLLSQLDMAWVPVTDINALSNLIHLKRLNLFETSIHDISPLANLRSLKNINLAKTALISMPEFLLDLELDFINKEMGEEDGIYIKDLSLKDDPIEVFYLPRNQIIEYLRNKNEKNNDIVGECKVVLLGGAAAGKSMIVDRLLNDGERTPYYNGIVTEGISIASKEYMIRNNKIVLHFWDFGGQSIYHSLHHLFFTQRTLYIIVLNNRFESLDEQARYWLSEVKKYANGSPALLVINQYDSIPSSFIDEHYLKEFYPYLTQKVVRMSAKDDSAESFNSKLVRGIFDSISEMKSVYVSIPKTWKRVIKELSHMQVGYITIGNFKNLCVKCGIFNYSDIWQSLLDWIADLGIGVLLSGEDSKDEQLVMSPSMLIDAISTIISKGFAISKDGNVRVDDLYNLLGYKKSEFTYYFRPEEVSYIIQILHRYEISFELKDGIEFFPMFCKRILNNEFIENIKSKGFHYIYKYNSFSESLIHRLMVKMKDDLDLENVSYYGAVFKSDTFESTAYVNGYLNMINIYVYSESELHDESEYMDLLCSRVKKINQEINIIAKEYICYSESGVEDEFSSALLVAYKESGIKTIYSERLDKLITIDNIIRTNTNANKNIVDDITDCLQMLKNNRLDSEVNEEQVNINIRDFLVTKGYTCKDQRVSSINKRKRTIEIDLVISDYRAGKDYYFESYVTSSFNQNLLQDHIEKLLSTYVPVGNQEMIFVVYVQSRKERASKIIDLHSQYILSQKQLNIYGELFHLYRHESYDKEATIQSMKITYIYNNVPLSVYYFITSLQ